MKTVLIADDEAILREPLELVLRGAGYRVRLASDGAETLAALGDPPDLLLLDLAMPAVDGLEVLARLRKDPRLANLPVIVLSQKTDRARIIEAAKLGISAYILKTSFSMPKLLGLIEATIGKGASAKEAPQPAAPVAPHSAPPPTPPPTADSQPSDAAPTQPPAAHLKAQDRATTRDTILKAVAHYGELRALSPAVAHVLKLTADPHCSIEGIAKAVSQDQAMAVKILKVANSAAFTRGEPVDSVHRAVVRIGLQRIRQTVVSLAVVDRFAAAAIAEGVSAAQFWEHGIGVGVTSALIAYASGDEDAEIAFTCGLLHDVGQIVLAEILGDTYTNIIRAARTEQAPLEAIESRVLGITHAEVGGRLLEGWRFPGHITGPVTHHHAPNDGSLAAIPAAVRRPAARLALADTLAHAMLLGTSGNDTIYPIAEWLRLLGLQADALAPIAPAAAQQTDDMKFALLASANAGVWPRYVEQLAANIEAWPRFIPLGADPAFDPLALLCEHLSAICKEAAPKIAVLRSPSRASSQQLTPALAAVGPAPVITVGAAPPSTLPDTLRAGPAHHLREPFTVGALVTAAEALTQRPAAAA